MAAGEDCRRRFRKVSSVCPGTNHVAAIPRRFRSSRIRGAPTRGPNSPCENLTTGSPRRTESEKASWSKVRATVSRGRGAGVVSVVTGGQSSLAGLRGSRRRATCHLDDAPARAGRHPARWCRAGVGALLAEDPPVEGFVAVGHALRREPFDHRLSDRPTVQRRHLGHVVRQFSGIVAEEAVDAVADDLGKPPTRRARTGVPQASASIAVRPNGSGQEPGIRAA